MLFQIHLWGLYFTEFLQTRFHFCDDAFALLSVITDPSILYTVYFPITYALVPEAGLRLLHAAAVGEWLNLFMKWIFLGERPYWWVYENNLHMFIRIKQFYNTCETGPGTPSGHVMIASMAFYVITSAIAEKIGKFNRLYVKKVWIIYGIIMFLMGISRAFIAAHFIHQCILGLICGLPLGKFINEIKFQLFKWHHYFIAAASVLGSMLMLELLLWACGVDSTWTIHLARKWCMEKSWIHVTTSPYYVMWRFTGTLLGLGFVCRSCFDKYLQNNFSIKTKMLLAVVSVTVSCMLVRLRPETTNNTVLYFSVCLMYMFNVYIIAVILPKLAGAFLKTQVE